MKEYRRSLSIDAGVFVTGCSFSEQGFLSALMFCYAKGCSHMQDDPIADVLDDLLKLDDILACMVARRNLISVMPSGDGFKPEVNQVWDIIKRAMDDVFAIISDYSQTGLSEMEFRLQEFEVLFYVFPDTENALVAIVPALSNKGLIDVTLERARLKIIDLLKD